MHRIRWAQCDDQRQRTATSTTNNLDAAPLLHRQHMTNPQRPLRYLCLIATLFRGR